MTKTELVAAMAENAELTKKDSDKVLNAFISIVTNELKREIRLHFRDLEHLKQANAPKEREEILRPVRQ